MSDFEARLVAKRDLSPGVVELKFERTDEQPLPFVAGQWTKVSVQTGDAAVGEVTRAYSVASAPSLQGRFELAVTRVEGGIASGALDHLALGDTVRVGKPQGFFTREGHETDPALFIATGTGIAPLRSMLLDDLRRSGSAPIWILLGVRHEEDILYRDEFTELAQQSDRFRFEVCLSKPAAQWTGRRGYVQDHLEDLYRHLSFASPCTPHVFVCGLERMVTSVRDVARKTMGLDRKLVHSERFD